jgi:hypothetical protein
MYSQNFVEFKSFRALASASACEIIEVYAPYKIIYTGCTSTSEGQLSLV